MRLFLALDLDAAARACAVEVQGRARRAPVLRDLAVRWVRPENLHLTLAFLGEVDADRVAPMARAAAEPWVQAPFRVELATADVAPRSGAPRTLWLSVSTGRAPLARLHAEARARMGPLLCAPVDPRPPGHVTLGRVRRAPRSSGGRVRDAVAGVTVPALGWRVDSVVLYESRLAPGGSSYRPLARAPLGCVILDEVP
ncbi:MAG: RNA 2',3'-cyclic phosphodiesterase [Acidobacteria bacterium]|nr:RNA 2',3'-cyclic phosphodiesterase [Acidobacteriota bacterium]